jgi:glycosyltransferase involved in cell wall biosynthesis
MSRPLQLAYLSLETPRPGQASQTHIDEIIASLRDRGWRVELFATSGGGASTRSSFLRRFIGYAHAQAALGTRLREFDAVFIRSHFMALPLALWARWRNVPVVHEINGTPADVGVTYRFLKPFSPVFSWLYRAQYRRAAHLLAVTPGLVDWARSFASHDRVSLVSNGANTDLFKPDGACSPIEGRYVIFVGGLVAWHGIGTMLAALKKPSWPADLRLIIVGDGIERDKVQDARSDPRLVWLGRQPYDAIPALLRGALAALCVIENQDGRSGSGVAPLKLFEAMACGVPVIASELPFQAELVRQERAGLVIPASAPDKLAAAVAQLAEDAQTARAMGANGADYVVREASWRRRGDDIHHILKSALRLQKNA